MDTEKIQVQGFQEESSLASSFRAPAAFSRGTNSFHSWAFAEPDSARTSLARSSGLQGATGVLNSGSLPGPRQHRARIGCPPLALGESGRGSPEAHFRSEGLTPTQTTAFCTGAGAEVGGAGQFVGDWTGFGLNKCISNPGGNFVGYRDDSGTRRVRPDEPQIQDCTGAGSSRRSAIMWD
jgi:hypothetical protein